ncbi:uncharacterized protein LOC111707380 [Eurytemora carolleeae]|uniref:uncharacterized protein LOC111707380 n=1 Tax=Eurytemora carolleeae TaxID=1294199 RepID=UPI000C77B6C4|nr:uncharacterized protein LOC111707380 [Eurytemora carolleeae]|eukprot:XP_023336249.1 uncharacterized protein LOC111707380 [Eurytemora affinis]
MSSSPGESSLAIVIICVMSIVVCILICSYCRCLCKVANCSPGCGCSNSRNGTSINQTSVANLRRRELKNGLPKVLYGPEQSVEPAVKYSVSTPDLKVGTKEPMDQAEVCRSLSQTHFPVEQPVPSKPSESLLSVPGLSVKNHLSLDVRRNSTASVLSSWRDNIND